MSRWMALCAVALALAGCATETVTGDGPSAAALAPAAAAAPAVPPYKLTDAELKLDCGKLTGQMKVKIAVLRGDAGRPSASAASRTIQQVVTPVYGGTQRGADPAAEMARDRAKLDAFNARLVEKKCKPLDIDAELRGETPPPAARAAPKKA
jgi:hypothetical protein